MISYRNSSSLTSFILCYILVFALCTISTVSAQDNDGEEEITPTLGLEEGYLNFETPGFQLKLVKSSQTIAALEPKNSEPNGFDFTPSDRIEQRNGDNFYHLGDLNVQYVRKEIQNG